MFLVAAEANTSAGAPLLICSARAELAPKLNFTVSPGWAASNCLPSSVNVPFSEDAASTVIAPVCAAELLAAGADELLEPEAVLDELLLEQPATAIAASATAARAKRRMLTPWLHLHGRDQLSRESQPCPPHDRPTWPDPVWIRRAPPRPRRAAVKAGSFLAKTGIITRTL